MVICQRWGTGHESYGGSGEAGRRAPARVRRRRKRQSPGERAAEGGGPYGGLSIEKRTRKRRTSTPYHQMSGSEKRSWSIRRGTNPRSIQLRVGSHSGSAIHSAAPPYRPPLLLFLFWTVHGPFSRFLLEEKEKMGGALHQPSLVSIPPRPQGQAKSPLDKSSKNAYNHNDFTAMTPQQYSAHRPPERDPFG